MTDDTTDTVLDQTTRRQLKRIAHHLQPVVAVGDQGVTDAVVSETNRALADHELIKVRIASADREARRGLTDHLAAACGAVVVQRIGKVCVLFRKNPQPNPKLSNLSRFGL
jgi:RNA-binding protein